MCVRRVWDHVAALATVDVRIYRMYVVFHDGTARG